MILSAFESVPVLPIVLVAVFIVLSLISSGVKGAQAKKKQGKKSPVLAEVPPDSKSTAEKSPDEQFDEIVKKMEAQKSAANAHRDEKQKAKNQKNDKNRYDSRNAVSSSDDTGSQHKGEKKASAADKHSHPVEKTAAGTRVRVEKKPTPTGSLGEDNDEGCGEHGDLRYVLEDVSTADEDAAGDLKELQRLIVWGEILDTPRSRSKRIR